MRPLQQFLEDTSSRASGKTNSLCLSCSSFLQTVMLSGDFFFSFLCWAKWTSSKMFHLLRKRPTPLFQVGALMDHLKVQGTYNLKEMTYHINLQELRMVNLAMKGFLPSFRKHSLLGLSRQTIQQPYSLFQEAQIILSG